MSSANGAACRFKSMRRTRSNPGIGGADDAQQRAERELDQLLPDGLASKDQYLFSIVDEALATNVGMIWFAVVKWGAGPSAFIYDFRIFDEFQRRGYATQALLALEEKVRALEWSIFSGEWRLLCDA